MRCILIIVAILALATSAYAQWEYGGKLISGESWPVGSPDMCADGQGGVLLAWEDGRNSAAGDIYVQKVDSAGSEIWPHDGILACQSSASELEPFVVSNGHGGAMVFWYDIGRHPPNLERIFGQNVSVEGNLLWPDTGLAVINWGSNRELQAVASDGHDGAIIFWISPGRIQRVNSAGSLLFGEEGFGVTDSSYVQVWGRLIETADSCFVATWIDRRPINGGLYAQKFNINGERLWDSNGVPVAMAPADVEEDTYKISPSSGGGIYVFWSDYYAGTRMQWIDGSGRARWDMEGRIISPAISGVAGLCTNYDGRAIISWIYDNNPPPFTGHFNLIDTSGTLQWPEGIQVDNNSIMGYGITQSIPGQFEIGIEMGYLTYKPRIIKYDLDLGFVWGDTGIGFSQPRRNAYRPILVSDGVGGVFVEWKQDDYYCIFLNRVYPDGWTVPDTSSRIIDKNSLKLQNQIDLCVYPNPFNMQTIISIKIMQIEIVEINLFDLLGRKIKTIYRGIPDNENFSLLLDMSANSWSSGIYFIEVKQNQHEAILPITLIK